MAKPIDTLGPLSRPEWRKWLEKNHSSRSEIWLAFARGEKAMSYNDAVEEALCFGWIDSIIRHLDGARYARKFTPRKENSKWSTINRARYADLQARGLLAPPGLKRAPTEHSYYPPRRSLSALPSYIEAALKANPLAQQNFQQLAPSYRRAYIGWIDAAKRQETKDRRLREALDLLSAGKKLGIK